MAITKQNIPVITDGGIPNANNLSDEASTIETLAFKTNRSNIGQILYTSSSSGISYNTNDYSSDSAIYNKGETGLYNLLLLALDTYMIKAENLNSYGTGVIPTTGWSALVGSNFKYSINIPIAGVLSSHYVNVVIDKESLNIAMIAKFSSATESYDGGVTLCAYKIPTSSIPFSYTVLK